MTTLMRAFSQWSTRPADERFASLDALHAQCRHFRDIAVEAPGVNLKDLHVAVRGVDAAGRASHTPMPHTPTTAEPVLVGPSGEPARFTHYSFGQLARRVDAPASYLRTLPPSVAADALNAGLAKSARGESDNLLFSQNGGGLQLRCATTPRYKRIWNADVTARLIRLTRDQPEWQPAPAAFDGSRGLYASDADMFAFLVDNDRRIFESLPGGGLGRGFFVWNSEVGATSFGVMTFLYEYVCGNHRVWGAKGVRELRVAHVGNADERAFAGLAVELRKYADSSVTEDEARIVAARTHTLGATKDELLDAVFALNTGATRALLTEGYTRAVEQEDRYGNPLSVWGFTGGLTEVARDLPNADDRVALDRAAGKILQITF